MANSPSWSGSLGEHGCATELHPVYGLAIHINDNPQDDTWAIFVRNWGNEGYCSQDQHPLDTNRMAFFLPRQSATAVNVNTASTFLTDTSEAGGPFVSLVPDRGATVEFELLDPTKGARINGELHLQWTVAPGAAPAVTVVAPSALAMHVAAEALGPRVVEIEQRLGSLLAQQLPPDARRTMTERLARPRSFDELTPRKMDAALPKPARPASTRPVADPHKAQRDLERAEAICAAFGRNIPGMPDACATVPP
jgi:hypothetical protein